MLNLFIAFSASLIATLLIIRFEYLHGHITGDHDFIAPQKFHKKAVPRVGGISIFLGLIAGLITHKLLNQQFNSPVAIILCATPAFLIGLSEDITKKVGVKIRLFIIGISAFLSIFFLDATIATVDLPVIDVALSIPFISIIFTAFAITGLTNAYNIIDGFNGLASMVGILTLGALAYTSFIYSDVHLVYLSLLMLVTILGFFIWNYPKGLIFLGDGGAYLIGFWIATISILLVVRHQTITPWFGLLVNGYPIMETIFTIYRRKIRQNTNPGEADGIHFHSLLYRRAIISNGGKTFRLLNNNSKTSPLLWILSCSSIVPAIFFRESTLGSIFTFLIFSLLYIRIYQKFVKFQSPAWLKKL